jgi:hypothetical protein
MQMPPCRNARLTSALGQAKALVIFTKIPPALIMRFPMHSKLLEEFSTLKKFHLSYPAGKKLDGSDVEATEKREFPVYGAESLDKLVTDVFGPLMLGKRAQSLVGATLPLGVSFIREALPTIEQMHASEGSPHAFKSGGGGSTAAAEVGVMVEEASISQEEGAKLKKDYDVLVDLELVQLAKEYLTKNVLMVHWGQSVLDVISQQPMLQDGAARLWHFNGGLDATKNPPKAYSPWRMKGSIDEDHWKVSLDVASKMIGSHDTFIVLSGRNTLFYKDAKKAIQGLRPKVGYKDLVIEPDETQVAKVLRLEANSYGSVDMSEQYLQIVKDNKTWGTRLSQERRFVPGNTAFRKMSQTPVLFRANMTTIQHCEREKVLKTVLGSDKYSRATASAEADDGKPTAEDEDEENPEEDADASAQPAVVEPESQVVFFWMESHPRVGNGMMSRSC